MSDNWNTPPDLIKLVEEFATIKLDPCWNYGAFCHPPEYYDGTLNKDGLKESWDRGGLVFCNPPYSKGEFRKWAQKMVFEASAGVEIIALVPANTETYAWETIWDFADAVCFPHGRICFWLDALAGESPRTAHAFVYFGKRLSRFHKIFGQLGAVCHAL